MSDKDPTPFKEGESTAPVPPTVVSKDIDKVEHSEDSAKNPPDLRDLGSAVTKLMGPTSDGPELPSWKPNPRSPPRCPIKIVKAIGDLHGWAPGLITYLISNQLARIEINGIALHVETKDEHNGNARLEINKDNMNSLFPSPAHVITPDQPMVFTGLRDFPTSYEKTDVSNVLTSSGFHSIKAEWIAPEDVALVQVGDVFDRGDYSELAAEILRQLVMQVPFRVFVLLGNHEQFFIEDDYDNWIHNEDLYDFTNVKEGKGFHTLFHQTKDAIERMDIKARVFARNQITCALLYLTQHCAQLVALREINTDNPVVAQFEEEFRIDTKSILDGGWGAYTAASRYLVQFNKKRPFRFPGAIIVLGLGHAVFIHAEPKAFSDGNLDTLSQHTIQVKVTPGLDLMISLYRTSTSPKDPESSPDAHFLWARGGSEGSTLAEPHPAATAYVPRLIKVFPGTRHVIHGHTPTVTIRHFVDIEGNFPVTYLARNYGEALQATIGSIRIHNIDEGISPVYQVGTIDAIFDPSRIPIGLLVHVDLLQFQLSNTEFETETIEWRRVMDRSANKVPFEIPARLTISERNRIGLFSQGGILWPSNLEPDLNLSDSRFHFPQTSEFASYRLFRATSKLRLSPAGLSFMLYDKTKELMVKPNKLYITSLGRNEPIDKLIFEETTRQVHDWLTQQRNGSPVLPKSTDVVRAWLLDIFDSERQLGTQYDHFNRYGLNCAIYLADIVFISIGVDNDNHPYMVIINGGEESISISANIIRSTNRDVPSKMNASLPKISYRLLRFDQPIEFPFLLYWGVSETTPLLEEVDYDAIIERRDQDTLHEIINHDRFLRGLIWFDSPARASFPTREQTGTVHDFINRNQEPAIAKKEVVTPPFIRPSDLGNDSINKHASLKAAESEIPPRIGANHIEGKPVDLANSPLQAPVLDLKVGKQPHSPPRDPPRTPPQPETREGRRKAEKESDLDSRSKRKRGSH